jgi:hypothetical protein
MNFTSIKGVVTGFDQRLKVFMNHRENWVRSNLDATYSAVAGQWQIARVVIC